MKTNPPSSGIARNGTRPGFTLVELLVTITIIIILAALAFMVAGKFRSHAQQANAVSAMRQVGIANVGYHTENNGSINVIRDAAEKGQHEGKDGKWVSDSFNGRMQPFLFAGIGADGEKAIGLAITDSMEALLGSSDLRTMAGTIFSGVPVTTDGSGVRTPFAINDRLRPRWGNANPPMRVSSYGDPSAVLYMTFGRYYFNELLCQEYRPLPRAGDTRRAIYFLPDRKGVFCFLDGHVELLNAPIDGRLLGERPAS
jgi:prepilin-type N-terminal cleavage/methylation domain-containing protein/prepilin-type processing-associated H-X9-DG protein